MRMSLEEGHPPPPLQLNPRRLPDVSSPLSGGRIRECTFQFPLELPLFFLSQSEPENEPPPHRPSALFFCIFFANQPASPFLQKAPRSSLPSGRVKGRRPLATPVGLDLSSVNPCLFP